MKMKRAVICVTTIAFLGSLAQFSSFVAGECTEDGDKEVTFEHIHLQKFSHCANLTEYECRYNWEAMKECTCTCEHYLQEKPTPSTAEPPVDVSKATTKEGEPTKPTVKIVSFRDAQAQKKAAAAEADCFHPDDTVWVKGIGSMSMTRLATLDKTNKDDPILVRALDRRTNAVIYSKLTGWIHRDAQKPADYIQLATGNGRDPLRVSANHILFVDVGCSRRNNIEPKMAGEVTMNDCLRTTTSVGSEGGIESSPITSISTGERALGVYAPLTADSTVIVNDVIASCYSNVQHEPLFRFLFDYVHFFLSFVPDSWLLNDGDGYATVDSIVYPILVQLNEIQKAFVH